jgi:hypothetical protein
MTQSTLTRNRRATCSDEVIVRREKQQTPSRKIQPRYVYSIFGDVTHSDVLVSAALEHRLFVLSENEGGGEET